MLENRRSLVPVAPAKASSAKRLLTLPAALALGAYLVATSLPGVRAEAPTGVAANYNGSGQVAMFRRGTESYALSIRPNRATVWNRVRIAVAHRGVPLSGADITVSFSMSAMPMGRQSFRLTERYPGSYSYLGPALLMPGRSASRGSM